MPDDATTPTRSRADRYGQLVFVLVACGLLGWAFIWGLGRARPHWWFWPLTIVNSIAWVTALGAGIAASLDKTPRGGR